MPGLPTLTGALAAGPLSALRATCGHARLVWIEAALFDESLQASEGAHHALARALACNGTAAGHQGAPARFDGS
ncbi:hypothetical protein ARD30_11160 [Bosea thiooxidans]|uniref:Uncharacterized protein n=1 Tax=Bosea thiooxidans TaxID=53254 RepID=A0A0Q3T056_9HYPH|nr:hypothetical protein ARD30_11160 [Bosea thiooxidans]